MSQTQVAGSFIGRSKRTDHTQIGAVNPAAKIIITHGQTDEILDVLRHHMILKNEHEQDKPSHMEKFSFTTFADQPYAQYLTKMNRLLVTGEDGDLIEFVIGRSKKIAKGGRHKIEIIALAASVKQKYAKIIEPHSTESVTAAAHAKNILAGTEVEPGFVEHTGIRKITYDKHTNPYDALKKVATTFDLEIQYRVETDNHRITKRYVDLVNRIGRWRGRQVTLERDLTDIYREEISENIVTALKGIGPERDDGTRLEVLVEDKDALRRWGRNGQHIIDKYEPETDNQDMSEEQLETLTRTALNKRINASVSYEAGINDLENVPGLDNKEIRFGDTIQLKDLKFNPPLYLEARIFNQKRDIFNPGKKKVKLGDFIEYDARDIHDVYKDLREEIEERLKRERWKIRDTSIRDSWRVIGKGIDKDKENVDARFIEISDNPSLPDDIKVVLFSRKDSYDEQYNSLSDYIAHLGDDKADDEDKEADSRYQEYKLVLSALNKAFDAAQDKIGTEKDNAIRKVLGEAEDEIRKARERLKENERKIGDAEVEIGKAKKRLGENETKIGEAESAIGDAKTKIGNLRTDLRNLDEKKAEYKELIPGVLIDDNDRIEGINLIIDGNALVTGRISAPEATFLDLSTERLNVLNALIKDSTLSGTLNGNEAILNQITTNKMVALKAIIDGATIKGVINGDEAVFEKGTYKYINAIGGNFEDITVTGTFTSGKIDGVDIYGSNIEGGRFYTNNASGSGAISTASTEIQGGKVIIKGLGSQEIVLEKGKMSGGEIEGTKIISKSGSSTATLDDGSLVITQSGKGLFLNSDSLRMGGTGTGGKAIQLEDSRLILASKLFGSGEPDEYISLESKKDALVLKTSGNEGWEFSTRDSYNHGFIRSGRVGLKMLNSLSDQMQIRNYNDSDYADLSLRKLDTTGDVRIRGDLKVDGSTSRMGMSLSSDSDEDGTINVLDVMASLEERIKKLEGVA